MNRIWISISVTLAGVFLFASMGSTTALPPGYAPMQAAYYYGDADGDTAITVSDMNVVLNYVNAQPYTFYTLQPDNSDADWNTCDVDSDLALTVSDKNILLNYVNAQPVNIPDKPWLLERCSGGSCATLSGVDLRDTYNTVGVFFPFNVNLSSASGSSGRPGISVIANIIGGTTTGSMSGRECDVLDQSIPDQAALPGAQCALAVTVTDWITDPALGLTEFGTYGLQVQGDGNGTLILDVSIQDNGLNVPATNVQYEINIGGGTPGYPPTWSTVPSARTCASGSSCGPTVNGIATDGDTGQTLTCSATANSCTGVVFTYAGSSTSPVTCNLTINATAAAPQSCNLRVQVADNGAPAVTVGATIPITISNQAPTWSTAPSSRTCASGSSCGPAVNGVLTDPNYGQTLTCAIGPNSCTGIVFTYAGSGPKPLNCNLTINATAAAPQTCNLRLVGSDNGAPALTVGTIIPIIISNQAPTWATAPSSRTCASGSSCGPAVNGALTDPNYGQTLTCSMTANNCTGVIIIYGGTGSKPLNCNLTIDATNAPPQTCTVRLQGADNGTPSLTVGTTAVITLSNQAPTWVTAPIAVTVASGAIYGPTVNGIFTDPNAVQTLTCSAGSTSCVGTTITYTGTGPKPLSCNLTVNASSAAPQSCNLRVQVADNATPALTVGATIAVTITNQAPTWATAPAATTCYAGSTCGPTVNGIVTDPNAGQTLTCSAGSNSCTGVTFTYSGSGAKPVSCNLTVNATAAGAQTCNLRLRGADNGTPSLTVGQTITITINALRNWTIMVFLDGDNNLEPAAINDFNEMEKGLADAIAAGNTDIQDSMKVVVMLDRITGEDSDLPTEQGGSNWTDTRLYLVKADSIIDNYFRSERLDDGGAGTGHIANLGERNMGDPAQLSWFVSHSKTNFPAAHYMLVLWNHGAGVRGPGDSYTSSVKELLADDTNADVMYLDELQQVINANFTSGNKLSILGFDACLMGMVEVAYEFRNLAQYMVGSMHLEQGDGWDYDYIFSNLTSAREDSIITASNFSILLVEQYKEFIELSFPATTTGETMAATDLSQISSLVTNVNALAVQMDASNKKVALETLRDTAVHFYEDDIESISIPFYDLYDFCNKVYNDTLYSLPAALKTAANNVITSLSNTIVYSYGDDGNGQSYYYGPGSSTKRGLSIFNSRGDYGYGSPAVTLYAYEWWYTAVDTNVWWPGGHYYGLIDFCTSDWDGTVESWRELFEKWYDPLGDYYTPSSY